ncbi:MAG: LLM class flavin-dependent oxidoreductase [Thermomicrobiales bacterium]|nr:LLM class flavin-dependent oxidoreductase [Thermomicrobiales bacterium]
MNDGLPRFGVYLPNFGPFADPMALAELGREIENAGWDGMFLWDHIAWADNPGMGVVDPWIALAAVADATSHIRLGALITPIARRRPWKLARETVSLDHLSRGRLVFGTGLGYSAPVEFAAFGEPVDDRLRAQILDEGLEVLDRLWSGEPVKFAGEHLQVDSDAFLPRPVQRPRIPVWVAGWWPRRRPFERAARWDGVFAELPGGATPDPDDVDAIAERIASLRGADGPFDLVIGGRTDAPTARGIVEPYAANGATWWLEKVDPSWRFSIDGIRRRIDAGPTAT